MRVFQIMVLSFVILVVGCKSNKQTSAIDEAEIVGVENPPKTEPSTPPPPPEPPASLESSMWIHANPDDLPDLERAISPSKFDAWHCDYDQLLSKLNGDEVQLLLPASEGLEMFNLTISGVMSEALAAKYPNIKSYKGRSTDRSTTARVDTNEKGLFAEFKTDGKTILIAPLFMDSKTIYCVYNKIDLPQNPRDESFEK